MLSKIKLCAPFLLSPSPLSNMSPLLKFLPTMAPQVRDFSRLTDPNTTSGRNFLGKYRYTKDIDVKDPFDNRQEMYKDGFGITLYDIKDGERKNLPAVVSRFKRLDWGQWIRPRSGRDKKRWKKSMTQLVNNEKHVFVKPFHKRRFDRAVTMEIKAVRHIPEDPYKVYNDMSWQNYSTIKRKNMELLKKYGPTNYNFPQHVAHPRKTRYQADKKRRPNIEPPGYHKDIHDGDGVYKPDLARPQDIMPPDYELVERHESNTAKTWERKHWKKIRRMESFAGPLSLCSKLKLPVVGTRTG